LAAMSTENDLSEYNDIIISKITEMRISGKYIIVGDRCVSRDIVQMKKYYQIFDSTKYRKVDKSISESDISGLENIGFDNSYNSYWFEYTDKHAIIVIFDKYGNVLMAAYFDNLIQDIFAVPRPSIFVSGQGNLYFMVPAEKGTSIYCLKSTRKQNGNIKIQQKDVILNAIIATTASSMLTEKFDKNMYHPVKAFDGKPDTGWMESVKGPGIGEWIEVKVDKPVTADKLMISPGWFDSRYWAQNNRIKSMRIELDDYNQDAAFTDKMTPQEVKLPAAKTFSRARFIVKDVYLSGKDNDTCISEIEFWNAGKKLELDLSVFAEQMKVVPQ
jgi:hypothetical protein